MELAIFFKGLVIGFSIAAPVGPIGVLCMRRTLAKGQISGLVSGLDAASADLVYGCIAGFGLTFLSDFLVKQQMWFRIIGGGFLCYLGIKALFAKPVEKAVDVNGQGLAGAYVSTFFLTLTNPMTILAFAAIYASLGLVSDRGNYQGAITMIMGVFIGSITWWLVLSGGVSLFRSRLSTNILRWVNRLSGMVIIGFGIFSLLSVI